MRVSTTQLPCAVAMTGSLDSIFDRAQLQQDASSNVLAHVLSTKCDTYQYSYYPATLYMRSFWCSNGEVDVHREL